MSTSRKLAFNVVIASVSKVLNTIVALVGIKLVSKYLGVESFGLYVTALAFSGLFAATGDWGLYQTSTRAISRPKAREESIIGSVMSLRIVISLGIALLTPFLIYLLPYGDELKLAIMLILLSYIFYSFYQILIGLFQKRLIMYKITLTELLGKIIQLSIIFIGVHFNLGFKFIILGITLGMLSNFIIIYLLSRKFIKFNLVFSIPNWKKFLRESWPIGLSVIVTFIYFKADIFLLKWLSDDKAVGIYGAGYKVLENITFFPGLIMGLVMPMLSFYIMKDKKKFHSLINENFKLFIILIIPLVVITMFFAENIILLITSPEYIAAATVLRIVIFSLAFIFFGMLFGNILVAAKLQKQQLIALSVCAIFNVTANIMLIPKYSYLATSYVSVATELLVVILSAYIVYKNLNFLPKVKNILSISLAGLLMVLYIFLLQSLPFFFLLMTGPLVYFSILIMLKVITPKELSILTKN